MAEFVSLHWIRQFVLKWNTAEFSHCTHTWSLRYASYFPFFVFNILLYMSLNSVHTTAKEYMLDTISLIFLIAGNASVTLVSLFAATLLEFVTNYKVKKLLQIQNIVTGTINFCNIFSFFCLPDFQYRLLNAAFSSLFVIKLTRKMAKMPKLRSTLYKVVFSFWYKLFLNCVVYYWRVTKYVSSLNVNKLNKFGNYKKLKEINYVICEVVFKKNLIQKNMW